MTKGSIMDKSIDWSRYEDIAGQLPSLQGYTQFCLFFPNTNSSSNKDLILKLVEDASVKLTNVFPWLSGQIANEGSASGNSGIFRIIPYRDLGTGFDICTREDLSLDYQRMSKLKMPMNMLEGSKFSPKFDLSHIYSATEVTVPVIVLQLSFVTGGMAMTFAAAHNAFDMTGLGKFIELFGKTLRNEEITEDEIKEGNRDRKTLFKLLSQDDVMLDHTMLIADPEKKSEIHTKTSQLVEAKWGYIRFDAAKLIRLKELASLKEVAENTDRHGSSSKWISTDDAISAFLWKHITLARHPRISTSSSYPAETAMSFTLCRAVNARRFFNPPVPASYMGHMVCCTYNSSSLQLIKKQHLSIIAGDLRDKLSELSDYSVRSFFSFINEQRDKKLVNYMARMDLSKDLAISSGAGLGVYNVDFGPMIGKPEWVRRPKWDPVEGLIYLMPKARDGTVDAAVCLIEQDWHELQQDKIWKDFVEYIG